MEALLIGINSKYIHPSMGVFQLYSNCHYEVDYIEFNIKDDINKIIKYINDYPTNVIAFSCYIWNIQQIKQIIYHLKSKTIILGGPEASFNPTLLEELPINFIIKGEGEESFNELLDHLYNKINKNQVSNLYYFDNNQIKYTFDKLPDLNQVKHDLSLIKDFKNRICYVESSRGCYYNCSYCLASTEKPVRFFPIDEVKDNILYLLNNNARTIKFLDRSFNTRVDYINEILTLIRDNDNGISTFQFEVNGDSLNESTLSILNSMRKKSIRFEIGIQSTNPITIKAINRHQNFDKLRDNILNIRDNIVIHTDLIAGLPYENYESFKTSYNETFKLFTEELQLGILKELKGTVISKTKDLYGYHFEETSPYEVINNNYISKIELDKIRLVEIATDKFYNYGYYNKTIHYLFEKLNLNPFDTFLYLMEEITKENNIRELQFDQLTKAFYEILSKIVPDKEQLLFIIKEDYLMKNQIKPKIWWTSNISREKRKEIYELISKRESIDINDLYNYGHIEVYYNDYFVVNYKNHKIYKKISK